MTPLGRCRLVCVEFRGELHDASDRLIGCALAFATLTAGAAYAGDPYGDFGPRSSEPATQEAGADPGQAESAPDAYQALPRLQQQSENQPESYDSARDQHGPISGEYDMDDEGGH
jgi:hypothetical protein